VSNTYLFISGSDLFEKSDDILAHVCQADNDIVVVDVTESGVVSAFSSGLVQDQIPAVHSGEKILVFSEMARKRLCQQINMTNNYDFYNYRVLLSNKSTQRVPNFS